MERARRDTRLAGRSVQKKVRTAKRNLRLNRYAMRGAIDRGNGQVERGEAALGGDAFQVREHGREVDRAEADGSGHSTRPA